MTGDSDATDVHSLFIGRADARDFLHAGKLDDGIGLCLSGGGYRAMIYHAGALARLNELGFLPRLQEVASVSGGSIAAAALACAWHRLKFDARGYAENFVQEVSEPIKRFAKVPVDVRAVLTGLLPWRSAADAVEHAYKVHLLGDATLQDMPDSPRFTFMATNLQTGSGWRFGKAYAADYRVGQIENPAMSLARVVAASSAFPPFLSPVRIRLGANLVKPTLGADLHRHPFTTEAVLTDGGVYDNLGLERVWKRCKTVLVSNAGKTVPEVGKPTGRWVGQFFRTLNLIQQQAENSRRRILFGMHNLNQRNVVYWDIATPISAYGVADALPMTADETSLAANLRTRLNAFSRDEVNLLLRAGYAGADAALRSRQVTTNEPECTFSGLEI
jgi:NTE family protein